MKTWLKGGLIGLGIGILLFLGYYFGNSFRTFYVVLLLTLPLSWLYSSFMQFAQTIQIALVEAIYLFYLFALLVEGFVIGSIVGLLIEKTNKSRKKRR